jgi:hypothetical protein
MNALRRMRPAAMAILLIAFVASPVLAEVGFIPGAITYTVDDTAKTITATVKMAFYKRGCNLAASCASSAADEASIARIVSAIEKMWNTGQKVRCYTFSVKVAARSISSQSEGTKSEVDIGLDSSSEVVGGYVAVTAGQVHGDSPSDPLGNTPDDRIDAAHDPDNPSTWPESTWDQVYAHEFGHVLGLEDNYQKDNPSQLVKGASEDLMFRKQGVVTQEMVNRVIDRSGQVKPNNLKCGWSINKSGSGGYTITGLKCDDLDGEWTIKATLTGVVSSTSTNTITIGKSLQGTFQQSTITLSPGFVTTINSRGHATVVLLQDGTVKMSLDATTATSTAVGADTRQTAVVPIPGQAYEWSPNTGTECSVAS